MDRVSKEVRSKNMAAVRSMGNRTTELRFAELLRKNKVTGWRRYQSVYGRPDFIFKRKKIAVFIDGCFWHGCRRHRSIPASNGKFWARKIGSNIARDKAVNRKLRSTGWRVLRFWEHQVNGNAVSVLTKMTNFGL